MVSSFEPERARQPSGVTATHVTEPVTYQGAHFPSCVEIPRFEGSIPAARNCTFPIRAHGDRGNCRRVTLEYLQLLASRQIPHFQCLIKRSRDSATSVCAHSDSV